ncbi:hypothetical protein EYR40_006415 [Pleurotus pulmonarius]|nr:hypothetical protein EYR36_011036 [Pleurotus pulmonarius]KAF4599323.1 hypothetical protein EYR40_006415 [Pleurotus pulmonarius]
MSIIGSIISFSDRSSRSVAPARAGLFSWKALMDSLLAIATGLVLRAVVSIVTHDDLRTTCTLIGVWEGIVLMHFLNKTPRSYDPYVAYGVRLFIDFLWTESLYRLVVVLLWTGMGMVLADITPIFWYDMGMRKVWHSLRRDLYIMSRSVRAVLPFGAKPRSSRVRFHERTRSASSRYAPTATATTAPSGAPSTFSITTTTTSTTATPVTRTVIPPTPARPRKVPGSFPGYTSESESGHRSVASSVVSDGAHGTSHSQFRTLRETLSSSSSTVSDDSDVLNRELPDIDQLQQQAQEVEIDQLQQEVAVKEEETPKPTPMVLPPTPADTLRDIDIRRANEVVEEAPPTATMPVIPDQNEWGFNDGWEEIDRNEVPPASLPPSEDDHDQHEKNLPPTPDDSGVQMPVPEPASPPIIPVPSPHHSSRHDTLDPPPSFEDIYGPDANDVPFDAPPSKSLIDFDGNDQNDYDAGNYGNEGEGLHHGVDEQAQDEGAAVDSQLPDANTVPPETQNNEEEHAGQEGQEQEQEQPLEQEQPQEDDQAQDQAHDQDQLQQQDSQLPPPSPSPPPSPVLDTPLPLPERVDEAVLLHETVSNLAREVQEAKQAQEEADKAGDKAGAIAEAVAVASKERALERAKKRLARRIFTDNNPVDTNVISLAGLGPEQGIAFVEETLEKLLLTPGHGFTELHVTLAGKKLALIKTSMANMLDKHHFHYTFKQQKTIIIQLPLS